MILTPAPAGPAIVLTRPKTSLSSTASVDKLDKRHPYYKGLVDTWDALDLLYRGGHAIQKEWARFLLKRPKELPEIWLSRGQRFNYENHLGVGLGWYRATLFKKDPEFHWKVKDGAQEATDAQTEWYVEWLQNVDRNGTTYTNLWRHLFTTMCVFREAYCCVDLPHADDVPLTLLEQKQSGGLDPYLMAYDPRSIINWSVDDFGNYNWIVIKTGSTTEEFLGDQINIDRWYYYDRTEYRIYERQTRIGQSSSEGMPLYGPNGVPLSISSVNVAKLIDSGPHALATAGRVPVRHYEIPEGLWLANRGYLPAVALINLQNSYEWSLFMANLAIPVIKTESEKIQTMSESAALQLAPGDSIEFAEPKGTSYKASAEAIRCKREELFRQMYLASQGRDSSASASASSGYSKEMDMMPSKDVLSEFGEVVRAGAQNQLMDVLAVREDEAIVPDVRGLNFEISTELQEAEVLEIEMSLDVPSDTFYKEKFKKLIAMANPDANSDVLQKMYDEVDASPSRSELAAQQAQMQQLTFARGIERAVTSTGQNAEQAGGAP